MLQQLQTQLDAAERQAQEANTLAATMATAHQAQLEALRGTLDLKVQDMQASMLQDAKVRATQDGLIQQLVSQLDLSKAQEKAAAVAAAKMAAAHQALTSSVQERMAAAEASSKQADATKTALIQQLTCQLQQSQAQVCKAEGARATLASAHQQELRSVQTAHQEAMAGLVAAHQSALQQQQQQLSTLQASHQEATSNLVAAQTAHAAELARVEGAHRQQLSQVSAAHKLEVAGLAAQVQQQLNVCVEHTRRSSSSSGCSTDSLESLVPVTSCSSSNSLYAAYEAPSEVEVPSSSCCVVEAQIDLTEPAAASGYPTSWEQVLGPSAKEEEQQAAGFTAVQQEEVDAATKEAYLPHKAGLANPAGSNFCCSNALTQSLRAHEGVVQGLSQLPGHSLDYVVEQQRGLFRCMSEAEASYQPGDGRIVVDPSQLCDVLAIASGSGANQMQDVGDLHNSLLDSFAASQAPGPFLNSRGAVADAVFGCLLAQRVPCNKCGKVTHCIAARWEHQLPFSSSELCQLAQRCPGVSQEQLLGRLLQEHKACDRDEKGCGQRMAVVKELLSAPEVLVLRPTWGVQVTGQDIGDTLAHLQQHLNLSKVLNISQVPSSQTHYWLTSMVVYYGQHYLVFIFCEELGQWLQADESCVKVVGQHGSWQEVMQKCINGKLQPGLITYQQVDVLEVARLEAVQQQQQLLQQQQQLCRAAGEGAVVRAQAAEGASGAGQSGLSKSKKKKERQKLAKQAHQQAGKQAGNR